jgi:Zn-dependent oligopeptidase
MAYHSNPANEATLELMLEARNRLASKLGFASYAEFALDDKMAKTPQRVRAFLREVHAGIIDKAKSEVTFCPPNHA